MESGTSNTLLYCLTIAFVGALAAFAFGTGPASRGDRYDLLLFFLWATFIPWIFTIGRLLIKPRRTTF